MKIGLCCPPLHQAVFGVPESSCRFKRVLLGPKGSFCLGELILSNFLIDWGVTLFTMEGFSEAVVGFDFEVPALGFCELSEGFSEWLVFDRGCGFAVSRIKRLLSPFHLFMRRLETLRGRCHIPLLA